VLCPGSPGKCAAAAAAVNRYASELSLVESANAGLATAGNRFSSARRARSASAALAQSAAGKAFAGEVAYALAGLTARGAALVQALGAVGAHLGRAELEQGRLLAERGFPRSVVNRLRSRGISAATLSALQQLARSTPLPASLSISNVFAPSFPTNALKASNHSITLGEINALAGRLAKQHAIRTSASKLVTSDLNAINTAHTGRTAAVTKLLNDIAANTNGAAGTLLYFAARGLTSG
jgi:hypothetical protein